MSVVGDRVAERLRALGRERNGQTWLASLVDMRQQGIQSIIAGKSKRPRKLREIAIALQTTQEYLLGETDDPSPLWKGELTYEPLPEDDPDWQADAEAQAGYSNGAYTPSRPGALPEIDVQAGAGEGTVGEIVSLQIGQESHSGHKIVAEWGVPEPYLRELHASPRQTIIMPVVGDSMEPTYSAGDKVVVDLSQNEMISDTVYVISDGEGPPRIKRLTRVMFSDPVTVVISSDNPGHERQTVELSRLTIVGRVCGVVARR